ncbi:MAG: glycosyltransferase family 2 protein, partial [Anaerolineales bacterium]
RPRLAFVQTRWGHVNAPDSLLTRVQALAIDAHFAIEQGARSAGGFIFNFNGTAGVWRRAAMEAAGGWRADTLTEDLDLSYRAFLRGWEALYLNEVRVPAELPATFAAYRRQQRRWALGSLQCARSLLPQVWSGPLSLASKVQATLHLTAYGIHLLMLALSLLYPFILWLSVQYPDVLSLFGLGYMFNLTVLAPTALFLAGQRRLRQGSRRALPLVLFLSIFGAGMMVNTLWAALQLFGPPRPFERTPKAGDQSLHVWLRGCYPLQLDRLVWAEFGFVVWNAGTALLAASLGNWVIAFYALLFAIGLVYVSGSSVLQALTLWRARKSPQDAPPQSL